MMGVRGEGVKCGTLLTGLLVFYLLEGTAGQTCTVTDDCTDSGTTCQDVRIPTKTGNTYGSTTEKRCVCTEAVRQPCFDTADCVRLFPDIANLNCFTSSTCPGQTNIGYCRIRDPDPTLTIDLRKVKLLLPEKRSKRQVPAHLR